MKVVDVLNAQMLVANIPFVSEGRSLPSKLQARLMLMRVTLDKAVNAYREKMSEVMKGLKPEGFDELMEEVKEPEEGVTVPDEKVKEYEDKEKELLEKYNEANKEEMGNDSGISIKKFTEDEFAQIIEVMTTEGEMDFKASSGDVKMAKVEFLAGVASLLVE